MSEGGSGPGLGKRKGRDELRLPCGDGHTVVADVPEGMDQGGVRCLQELLDLALSPCGTAGDALHRGGGKSSNAELVSEWKAAWDTANWNDSWEGIVIPTGIIDFPYRDQRGLNLQQGEELLERAWVYEFVECSGGERWMKRLVLHGHTNQLWCERGYFQQRAKRITAVKLKVAERGEIRESFKYLGGVELKIVPVSKRVRDGWRDISDRSSLEWSVEPGSEFEPPASEDGHDSVKITYTQLGRLIRLAEEAVDLNGRVESFCVRDTEAKMRGGEAGVVLEGEMVPMRRVRPRVFCFAVGADAYSSASGTFGPLRNAVADAQAVHKGFERLTGCSSESVLNPEARMDLRTRLRAALRGLQDCPPEVFLFYYAGHGIQCGSEVFLVPCKADPEDDMDLREHCLSLSEVFKLMKHDLCDKTGELVVTFVASTDSCRVGLDGGVMSEDFKIVDPLETAMPRCLAHVTSCSRGATASDGNGHDGHSPFAVRLLDSDRGIFAQGVRLKESLEWVATELKGEGQTPAQFGMYHIDADFCIVRERSANKKQSVAQPSLATEAAREGCMYNFASKDIHLVRREIDGKEACTAVQGVLSDSRVVVVHGAGGNGKSSLAMQVAEGARRDASGARDVLWIEAPTEEKMQESCTNLVLELGEQCGPSVEECTRALRQWLRRHERWMVVVDDLGLEGLLDKVLQIPKQKGCFVLVTTRLRMTIGVQLELGVFSTSEAIELVKEKLPDTTDPEAHRLVRILYGNPLALTQAVVHADNVGWSIGELADKLESGMHHSYGLQGGDGHSYEEMVRLQVDKLDNASRRVLGVLSYMCDTGIQKQWLHGLTITDLDASIGVLRKQSLAKVYQWKGPSSKKEACLDVHGLLQEAVRRLLTDDEREACLKDAVACICNAMSLIDMGKGDLTQRQAASACMPHALSIIQLDRSGMARDLWMLSAQYCEEVMCDFSRALNLYAKEHELRENSLGHDHVDVAKSIWGIAMVEEAQGKHAEALEKYNQVLEILVKHLGHDHVGVAATYNNMGNVLRRQGEYKQALEYYNKALKIELDKLGHDHVDVAKTYNNMGIVLQIQGEYEQALENYNKALKIRLDKLGHDHVDCRRGRYGRQHGNRARGPREVCRGSREAPAGAGDPHQQARPRPCGRSRDLQQHGQRLRESGGAQTGVRVLQQGSQDPRGQARRRPCARSSDLQQHGHRPRESGGVQTGVRVLQQGSQDQVGQARRRPRGHRQYPVQHGIRSQRDGQHGGSQALVFEVCSGVREGLRSAAQRDPGCAGGGCQLRCQG